MESLLRSMDDWRCPEAAGGVADRRPGGVLAVGDPPANLAALVARSATAARLGFDDDRVPGAGQAVGEPAANDADERPRCRHQLVAVPAFPSDQAFRESRAGTPRA